MAAPHGITISIGPVNRFDTRGYFLTTTTQAAERIGIVDARNRKPKFDGYPV